MKTHSALYELTVTRTKEFLRQGEAVFWVFVFPLLLALALGFAFREKPPDRIPIGVAKGERAVVVAAALEKSPALRVRLYEPAEGREALRVGRISLLVETDSRAVFRFDPTRPDSRMARMEAADAMQRAAGRIDPVKIGEATVTERGSRYIDFLIPGLLGLNLMGTGMWGVGFSIVTARAQKLLKRLVATPMRKRDYLLAQMFSRIAFLAAEVAVLVGFGWLVFDVGVRGSLLLLSVICFVGAMAFAGFGVLVAARAETIEAVNGLMNLVMLPMWLLSGVFFSADRFPDAAQPFIRALPLTALNDALREVMIEGAGLLAVLPELANLTIWCIVSFVVALKIFRWK
ncbi:MAG: ABC transporter permease [Thermoanaerobaculia bacterium]|nr:ABC transporter permease [Thermoanaerobaculia bacterium]